MNNTLGKSSRLFALCVLVGCGSFGDSKNRDGDGAGVPVPAPTTMTPALGPTLGGQLIAIQGKGFSAGATLLFGGAPATQIEVASPSVITALTPPHDAGRVPVQIVNSGGVMVDVPGGYEYVRGFDTAGRPRVVSALSTSNTTVRVTFSEPVAEGADVPSNFRVTHANVNPESGTLPVIGAVPSQDPSSVELTTASQNEVIYELTAANIRDSDGNLLAPPELLVNPAVVQFAGTPPVAGVSLVDSDGDGLSDNVELLGWSVTVWLSNGDLVVSTHTSDPNLADTDGDGLGDADELLANSNPRQGDTDGDLVSDVEEWNVWWSDPCKQDTDEEGLSDGIDIAFGLSPTLDDTDGDGYDDYQERFELNRNPLIADLPRPQVVVTGYDLNLAVKSSYTDETGTVRATQSSSTSSVSQATASSTSRSDTRSTQQENRFSQSLGVEAGYSTKDGFSGKISTSVGFEQSRASGYSSSVSSETARQSQQSYDKSVAEALESSDSRSITRSIESARIIATVNIANQSDVPFTIENLEISVLRQDRAQGGSYRPVGTLRPSGGEKLSMNLAPNDIERGPILFENTDIFPNLVDELLREPTGLVFKVANFDVVDEEGRNFAYSYATVNSRTAGITIDYGDGRVQNARVATHGPFDANGAAQGITIEQGLKLAGFSLSQNDAELPTPAPDPLPDATRFSVGTAIDGSGVERLVRVGGVQNAFAVSNPEKRFWTIQTNNQLLSADTPFSQIRFKSGQEYLLMYTRDIDKDGLFEREEAAYGSSDNLADSDGDGLDDFAEVRTGWTVRPTPGNAYKVFPSPARPDSDGDSLDDHTEQRMATDPNRADTDLDGLLDAEELTGQIVIELYDGDNDDTNAQILTLEAYTDRVLRDGGDGIANAIAEGDDIQVSPRGPGDIVVLPGPNGVLDTPAAGDDTGMLVQAIAPGPNGTCDTVALGDDVQVAAVGSPAVDGRCVHAGLDGVLQSKVQRTAGGDYVRALHELLAVIDPTKLDTDFDGIPDGREILVGTNPNANDSALVTDSDNDGLSDSEELEGWLVNGVLVASNPFRPDTDRDGLPDAWEFAVASNPNRTDTDGDGLTDLQELDTDDQDDYYDNTRFTLGANRCAGAAACVLTARAGTRTDLLKADTDSDGLNDAIEVNGSWTVTATTPSESKMYAVKSLPYLADSDSDGLNDSEESTRKTDPLKQDTDEDGTLDGVEPTIVHDGVSRDPAYADRLVAATVPSRVYVQGDCKDGDGGGTWTGDIDLFLPNGTKVDVFEYGRCNDVDEESTCTVNGPQVFFVRAGESFRYSSTGVQQTDGPGDDTMPNAPFSETWDYNRIVDPSQSADRTKTHDLVKDSSCGLTVAVVIGVQ